MGGDGLCGLYFGEVETLEHLVFRLFSLERDGFNIAQRVLASGPEQEGESREDGGGVQNATRAVPLPQPAKTTLLAGGKDAWLRAASAAPSKLCGSAGWRRNRHIRLAQFAQN